MPTVLTVVGARPQFIKAAVISQAFRHSESAKEIIVHTGQHYDANMSDVFFGELGIPQPHYNLNTGSGSHAEQTGRMLAELESVMHEVRPDVVLVYGDTNSTLAGALAAAKIHIPVAHVEAGLRSFNRRMPEEVNRVVADHLADTLFAPTSVAVENLRAEGITGPKVMRVGDVMYDLALQVGDRARESSTVLDRMGVREGEYLLVTTHRAENTDDPERLRVILGALCELASDNPIVFPVHPRTRAAIASTGLHARIAATPNLRLTDPVGYLDMLALECGARVVVTDSGGVQKEAYFHRVPCVTVRDETEWVELVAAGWNRLAPPSSVESVVGAVRAALTEARPEYSYLYGDGSSSQQIARCVTQLY